MAFYLDTSAAVKLVLREQESTALARWVRGHEGSVVSSDLLRTELLRAVRRAAPRRVLRARAVLDALVLVTLGSEVFERAALLEPTTLRSLDAVHIAAAMMLGDALDGVVTYDERMAAAAEALGLTVVAPR